MSENVEMEEEQSVANTGNQSGDKKRFEVKKVIHDSSYNL
jgi:hypothetical protein